MASKSLVSTDDAHLPADEGDCVTVNDTIPPQPLVTPNARLTSKDRHVIARSTGATVVARSSGRDVFARGGAQPLVSPRSPRVLRSRPRV